MILTNYQRGIDRKKAEVVLGHPLKITEVVHHHTDGTLAICENQAYHFLLHTRTRTLKACGHASWRKCQYCERYDDPKNMVVRPQDRQIYHRSCKNKYMNTWNRQNGKFIKIIY